VRIVSLAAVVGFAAVATATAQIVNVDYNTPGDLTGQFLLNVNPPTPVKYAQVASGGIGDSGAVDILGAQDAQHTTAVFGLNSFDFTTPGRNVTISQFVKRRAGLLTQTPFLMLGILSDPNERLDDGVANSYASIRLMPSATATATDVFLQTETKVAGGARLRTTPGLTASLAAGNWYRVEATFDYNGASDLLIGATIEDWGATGASLVSSLLSFPPTLVPLSGADQVNGDSAVWVGYRGFAEGGADLFDNFTATPEPGTLVLLTIGAGAARRARRRPAPSDGETRQ